MTHTPHEAPPTDSVRTYTPAEVAQKLGVHVRSVARWGDSGQLPFFRTDNGKRRYYADTIDQMTQSKRGPDA